MTEQTELDLTLVIVYDELSETHHTITLQGHGHSDLVIWDAVQEHGFTEASVGDIRKILHV